MIPANAKPGKSVIQVLNPQTGKPVRAKVPKEAVPGQAIELDLPDDAPDINKTRSDSDEPLKDIEVPSALRSDSDDPKQKEIREIPVAETENPVDHTIVYSTPAPTVMYAPPPAVVSQPVYISQSVPVISAPAPVIYPPKPNVIVVKEEKRTLEADDCCAAMFAACACTWFLLLLTGRN